MVTPRKYASSCSFNTTVYVVCGTGYAFSDLLSIERLDFGDIGWKQISIPVREKVHRQTPAVAFIEDAKSMVILGGFANINFT